MRKRFPLLAGVVSLALILSGCAGSPETPETTTASPTTDGAFSVTESGAAIEATQVSDNYGEEPEVTLPDASLVGDDIERKVVVEGDGAPISAASTVTMEFKEFDLGTGQDTDWTAFPQAISLSTEQLPAFFPAMLDGVASGSRVAVIVPGSVLAAGYGAAGTEIAPAMIVVDVEEVVPGQAADGEPQELTQDLVSVSANPGEQPEIEVHSEQPEPTEQVIDVVLKGDGETIADGDQVMVQYTGLLFSDGTEFDSSWSRGGMPSTFPTTGVVPGFANAMVGQTVGSRVVTVFPPELGYGDTDNGTIPPGSTLVFVIDIVGVM